MGILGVATKFRFISDLDINSGVADWNISSSATPSALKQQAYERFTIRLYQPSSSWSEQYPQSHSLSNSRSCHASSWLLLQKMPSDDLFSLFFERSFKMAAPIRISRSPI